MKPKPENSEMKRNVLLLSLSQALLVTCNSLLITSSALVGNSLTTHKSLATLPFALMFLTQMTTAIPASFFMGKVGRQKGFMTGAMLGLSGAVLTTGGIIGTNFSLFCSGIVFIGAFNGFGQYYRFAAAEVASETYRSRAISYVLAGGIVAAFVGPNLANWSRQMLAAEFAGSYACLGGLYLLSFLVVALLHIPRPESISAEQDVRPLITVVAQRPFMVAVFSAMVAYGAMNFIMIATPLAMQADTHSFSDTAFVIQWHVFGMYAPSFFTGHLIRRFGTANVMLAGIILIGFCVGINLSGSAVVHFWGGLLLLGLGWNFLFIGATALLTETYLSAEKTKAQALNDFLVFGTMAMTSFSSGAAQNTLGWESVNLMVTPLLVLCLLANLWLRGRPCK